MKIKKLGLVAIAAATVLSLSGCFKITSHYTLHDDDTVSGEIILAISANFTEGMAPDEVSQSFGESEAIEGIPGVKAESYDDGDFVGTKYTFEDQPLTAVAPAVDGTLVREGDTFVFQGEAPDSSETEGMEGFLDQAVATLKITFPGAVTDTNGSVSGTSVTWDLLTLTEAPYATGGAIGSGDDDSGLSTGVLIAILCGVIVLIVVVVVLVQRSKNKGKPPAKKPAAKKPASKKK